MNALLVERPAEALDDARQLSSIFLEGGDHAGLPRFRALEDEVETDQRLAHTRWAADQGRRTGPVPVGEQCVEGVDPGGLPGGAERKVRGFEGVGQPRKDIQTCRGDAVCVFPGREAAATQLANLQNPRL